MEQNLYTYKSYSLFISLQKRSYPFPVIIQFPKYKLKVSITTVIKIQMTIISKAIRTSDG